MLESKIPKRKKARPNTRLSCKIEYFIETTSAYLSGRSAFFTDDYFDTTNSRSVAQWLARKGLDRGQEPAHRISLCRNPGSRANVGCRVDGSNSRSGNCRRAASSRSPEIGNCHYFRSYSWLVFDPVAIGLVQSLARPGGNITGLCDLRGRRFRSKTNRNPPGTGAWRLENRPLSQSEQPTAQAGISRGGAPHSPEARRGSPDSRGDHG